MMFKFSGFRLLMAGAALFVLAGCERPPIAVSQTGFRGTAMDQIYNPRTLKASAALNAAPEVSPAIEAQPGGPTAGAVYQNVKVLGHLGVGEFARTMSAITEWVAPKQGCNYCHIEGNFADDSKYTKVVARRMLQMTQHINTDWKTHVAETGVTCYTCHRGNPVPKELWFGPVAQKAQGGSLGNDAGQNTPAKTVGYSSLPYDPYTPYLLENRQIRVNGNQALAMTGAAKNLSSSKQAEHTYGLMVHMSTSLGVNCTYCHNTQSFQAWEGNSTPQRATAWYGIRMARDINNAYMVPLTATFPANRLGPTGDVAKVNCASCHQGAFKPLYGAAMAKYYPALYTPIKPADPPPAPLADANPVQGVVNVASKLEVPAK